MTYEEAMNYVDASFATPKNLTTCELLAGSNDGSYVQALGMSYRMAFIEATDSIASDIYMAIVNHRLSTIS